MKGLRRAFYDDWNAILAAADLPKGTRYVPKNYRSTAGSEWIQAGVPTVVVRDLLGHSSVVVTERHYIHTGTALRAAVDKRSELRGR